MPSLCHRWGNGRSSAERLMFLLWVFLFCRPKRWDLTGHVTLHDAKMKPKLQLTFHISKHDQNEQKRSSDVALCSVLPNKREKKWILIPRCCGLGTICCCLCKTGMTTYTPSSGMSSVFLLSGLDSHGLNLKLLYPPSAHESGCTMARKLSLWRGFRSLLATTTSGIMEVESSSGCVLISPAPNVSLTSRTMLFPIFAFCFGTPLCVSYIRKPLSSRLVMFGLCRQGKENPKFDFGDF